MPRTQEKRNLLESKLLRRYFPVFAMAVQVLLDAITIFAACTFAYVLWNRIQPLANPVPIADYAPIFCGIVAIMLFLFAQFGMYHPQKSILNIEEFKGIFKAVVFGFLLVSFLHYALEKSVIYPRSTGSGSNLYWLMAQLHDSIAILPANTYSRYVLVLSFVLILLLLSAERWVCFKVLQYLHLRGVGTTNILIVGAGRLGRMIQKTLLLQPRLGYNLVGFLDDDPLTVGREYNRTRVLATTDQLARVISAYKVGLVLVAVTSIDERHRRDLAEACMALGVEIAFVPPLHVSDSLPPLRLSSVETIPLLSFSAAKPGPFYSFMKRGFDIVVAGLAILINLPLFILLPILIKLTSPGPALFRQERIGKDGREFSIFKFRTMRTDIPKYDRSPTSGDDPRLTRIGRLLRRTSLDELPQLFNVVKGDMSVVGPRPEMPFIVDGYDPVMRQRLRVKPGITGLWQISYARDEDIHENVDYDLYYVEHPSLTMDFVILILTGFSVIRGVGAH